MKKIKEVHIHREDVEKVFVALQYLVGSPLEVGKATQVIINYDPHRPSVTFEYYHLNPESDEQESQ